MFAESFSDRFSCFFIKFALAKRKIGRVTECAGLEIRYTPFAYRGFESLIFRLIQHNKNAVRLSLTAFSYFIFGIFLPQNHIFSQAKNALFKTQTHFYCFVFLMNLFHKESYYKLFFDGFSVVIR